MNKLELQSASFATALDVASGPNYLGDSIVLDKLLRSFAKQTLDRRGTMATEEASQKDLEDALGLAGILLGYDGRYTSMPKWNAEGYIDRFVASTLNVTGQNPQEVVAHVFVRFLLDIYWLVNYANSPGILEEQWAWQIDAIIEHYRNLLLGIRPIEE